jgi:hypothetical protein
VGLGEPDAAALDGRERARAAMIDGDHGPVLEDGARPLSGEHLDETPGGAEEDAGGVLGRLFASACRALRHAGLRW